MREPQPSRWATLLALGLVLLIAAAAVWYRLVREGRLPLPGRGIMVVGLLLLLLIPPVVVLGLRKFGRESEDAATLRRQVARDARAGKPVRDYSREYPLRFRPEWKGVGVNAGMTALTMIVAVAQSTRMSLRDQVLALGLLIGLVVVLVALLMSRRLIISWPGVTLKEIRRERFWAWDEIEAVVLWERRGRRRPALRLRKMNGTGELVSLGGIDFANEELLFAALLDRVGRFEMQVNGQTVALAGAAATDVEQLRALFRSGDHLEKAEPAAQRRAPGPLAGTHAANGPEATAQVVLDTDPFGDDTLRH